MPSLLSNTEIAEATGMLGDHFETFARNQVTIHKEPQKTFNTINQDNYFGYPASDENYTLVPVNQTFSGQIIKKPTQNSETLQLLQELNLKGEVILKVQKPARDYINAGKTEMVTLDDGRTFNISSNEAIQNFLGLKFYYFGLEVIK